MHPYYKGSADHERIPVQPIHRNYTVLLLTKYMVQYQKVSDIILNLRYDIPQVLDIPKVTDTSATGTHYVWFSPDIVPYGIYLILNVLHYVVQNIDLKTS